MTLAAAAKPDVGAERRRARVNGSTRIGSERTARLAWPAMEAEAIRGVLEQAFPDAVELSVEDRTGTGDHFQVTRRELRRSTGSRCSTSTAA